MAGFLAIMVTNMTTYYNKHHDFVFGDLTENMCCCRVVRKVKTKKVSYGLHYPLKPPEDCKQEPMDFVDNVVRLYRALTLHFAVAAAASASAPTSFVPHHRRGRRGRRGRRRQML